MSSSNLLKNVISKDLNIFSSTLKNLIESRNLKDFRELCQNSDFIFPNIKEKIIKNFIKLVEEKHLDTIFEFSKIYSFDFEDLIVKSWIKFASEDLTDKILELFESGTLEQKAYCAKYFTRIKDTLSIEYLNKYAYSDYEPLKINCAIALSAFGEVNVLNEMEEKILNSNNEFDKIEAYKFTCAYNTLQSAEFVLNNFDKSPFRVNIITYLLDFCDFDMLLNNFKDKIPKVFNVLLEGYPEDIGLETIGYYRIYDFVNFLLKNKNPYVNNLLALAKLNFEEYLLNENYHFNLDKFSKNELTEIVNLLKSYEEDFKGNHDLLKDDDIDCFKSALKVIEEYKLYEFAEDLSALINSIGLSPEKKAYIAQTLKALNKQNLIQKETISTIQNDNIKILIESLMV